MSDTYLILMPTAPTWIPDAAAAERAATALAALAPGAEHVEATIHDVVTFVDQGENFDRVTCPACASELDMEWWGERMGVAAEEAFAELTIETPRCGASTTLNDLACDWPAGFARTELSALNPGRHWLDDAECADVAAALGHAVKQVMARY